LLLSFLLFLSKSISFLCYIEKDAAWFGSRPAASAAAWSIIDCSSSSFYSYLVVYFFKASSLIGFTSAYFASMSFKSLFYIKLDLVFFSDFFNAFWVGFPFFELKVLEFFFFYDNWTLFWPKSFLMRVCLIYFDFSIFFSIFVMSSAILFACLVLT